MAKPKIGQQQERMADLAIREVKDDERRVTVSFSSEMPVRRYYGQEILCHDSGCVDMQRINDLGVALFNHNRDKVIGRIENARLDEAEKRTYADIVFDDDQEAERIYQKVKSGTLKGVSVAYSVDVWEEVAAGKLSSNGRFTGPAYIATRWTPAEISVVSVPADPTVGVGRELGVEGQEEEIKMNDERGLGGEATPPAPQENAEQLREQAVLQERQRVNEISELCRSFDIDPSQMISDGSTIDQARTFVLEQLRSKNPPLETSVRILADESDKIREAASDAIILRAGGQLDKPADGAKEMRGMRLRDLAIDCLMRAGVPNAHRLDDTELIQRALTADSQFGAIMSTTVNKSMAKAYSAVSTTYQAWTGVGTTADFKDAEVWQISEAGELTRMTQQGEFAFDEMQDSKVTKRIATFGREFGITRQAIINDDIGILTRVPEAYVRAANRGINKMVYQLLQLNGNIYDGKPLFDTAHKNIDATGAALSVASLGAAKAAMRKQTNMRGKERLNISPKTLIVPAELEVAALQLLNSTADPNGNNSGVANIFRNALSVIVDAELTDPKAWYLAASPADIDTIEVTYLNGDAMPKLESQVGFDYLGIKYRIYIDYGVNILDYRGLYKNAGK